MRVLVAEDDLVSERLLTHLLIKWGHEVTVARSGREAWEAFERDEDIQLVISDWMMPELDGIEFVRRVRAAARPGYVYFILLTAKTQREDLLTGMEAGADDFITKPFDAAELRVRLGAGERIVRLEHALAEQNRRMRRDLEAAAAIQRSLLPPAPPEVAGYRFAWRFLPCDLVAGDILCVHRLDESTMALYVLDVSGHGVPAAMLSVALSRALEPMPVRDGLVKRWTSEPPHYLIAEPREVLGELNQRFPMASQGNLYHTGIYATLDLASRRITMSRSGHPLPLLIRGGCGEFLAVDGGLPAGMYPEMDYGQTTCQLQSGDRLYLYSDGLTEAMDARGEMFGEEQLAAAMAELAGQPLEETLSEVLRRVHAMTGEEGLSDDVTLLALEVL